jgi:hypothetical protein
MKVYYFVLSLLLASVILFPGAVNAERSSITIVSPEKDSIIQTKTTFQFSVDNFKLTTRPEESSASGVINIYVDGAFFTNTATNSASLYIPRQGTHYIEAELVKVSRESLVPKIVDTMYIHVGKKSPYLRINNITKDQVVYESKPVLMVDRENLENSTNYYQVFVDGKVDGNSKELTDPDKYTLNTSLEPGKHTVKLALYSEDDRPVTPVVETSTVFSYSTDSPRLLSVELPKESASGADIPFKAQLENFVPGQDGYLAVIESGGSPMLLETSSGVLKSLKKGKHTVAFTLYDMNGRILFTDPPIEKVIEVKDLNEANKTAGSDVPSGVFTTGQDGDHPRWLFIGLAVLEGLAIITFAMLLFKRDRSHHHR